MAHPSFRTSTKSLMKSIISFLTLLLQMMNILHLDPKIRLKPRNNSLMKEHQSQK